MDDTVAVTVAVPRDQAQRIMAAVCALEGAVPQSETEAIDIVTAMVFRVLRDVTINYEAEQAAAAVRDNPDDPLVNATMSQA